MKIVVLILIFSFSKLSFGRDCLAGTGINAIKIAALGTFYETSDSIFFRPLVCLNLSNCRDIDLSNFPKYDNKYGYNPIWPGKGSEHASGELYIISSDEKSFEDAVRVQNVFVEKFYKDRRNYWISMLNPMNILKMFTTDDSQYSNSIYCEPLSNSSIQLESQGFLSSPIYKDSHFRITYSNKIIETCDCTSYLYDKSRMEDSWELERYSGFYTKKNNNFFVTLEGHEIELEDGNKCNPFIGDLIGKKISLLLPREKMTPFPKKLPFINACKVKVQVQREHKKND